MEDKLYKFVVFFLLNVSLYGRLFNESFSLYYWRNIFTVFSVGLSGHRAKLKNKATNQ